MLQLTLKDKSPKQPPAWVVRNQKSKRNADSESNTTSKGNGNCEKYRPGVSKKDHWASAREHFLPSQEEQQAQTMQRDESDLERKRRRRRRDDSGGSSGNGVVASRKIDVASVVEATKPRRVPQKLPLQTIERPQPRRSSTAKQLAGGKTSRTSTNNDLQSYVAATVKAWELEAGNVPERAEALKASLLEASTWTGQWRPQPDDVQPCSSKTIDPYPFG